MRAAGRHTVPPLILKRVRRPPPDPDSPLQPRQSPPAMRPASLCRPGNCRPPVMPPFSIQAQPLPHGAGGPHAKRTVVSRPRRPSTAKRGRGDSRKGPQLAGGLRREGVAEGRGCRGKGSRRGGVAEGRGAIGRPAAVSGRDPQGVRQSFSQALYHLQA